VIVCLLFIVVCLTLPLTLQFKKKKKKEEEEKNNKTLRAEQRMLYTVVRIIILQYSLQANLQ